jgi:hypothetical protein
VAQNNWWGNASGPSGSGTGSGVPVSANVDYRIGGRQQALTKRRMERDCAAARRITSRGHLLRLVGQAGTTYTVTVKVSATGGEPYSITRSQESVGKIGSGIQPGTALHASGTARMAAGKLYGTMRIQVTANLE